MKNVVIIAFVVILIVEIVLMIKQKKSKNGIEDKITKSILNEDFSTFYELIDCEEALKNIPYFNRQYMKLNVAFLSKEDKKIEKLLESMKAIKMNNSQMEEVCLKAFNYYVEKGNKNESKYYMNQILKVSKNENIRILTKRMYSIYIEKSNKYLDELLIENDSLKGKNRASNDLLISKIYENLNDSNLSKQYLNQYYMDIEK